jgi:hypothetical protein
MPDGQPEIGLPVDRLRPADGVGALAGRDQDDVQRDAGAEQGLFADFRAL